MAKLALTARQIFQIENSLVLRPVGYILNELINDRVKHPELYTKDGICRKWSIELAIKHIKKYKK